MVAVGHDGGRVEYIIRIGYLESSVFVREWNVDFD